jgi:hypothetical protein
VAFVSLIWRRGFDADEWPVFAKNLRVEVRVVRKGAAEEPRSGD